MKLAFILKEISYLKAFMPLIKLWDQKFIIMNFIYSRNDKITSPVRNKAHLRLLDPYDCIWFKTAEDIIQRCGQEGIANLITLEGMPFAEEGYGNYDLNIFAITHATDFYKSLDLYYDKVNWILFYSKYMAKNHVSKDVENKFLYTGASQYLTIPNFNRAEILEKYNLPNKKIILILGPPKKFYKQTEKVIKTLCDYAREKDCYVVYKTKKKMSPNLKIKWYLRKFRYLYDVTYFPFTPLELMYVSDLVINFDSTGIQEIITLGKKAINFYTKSFRRLTEIYEEEVIPDLGLDTPKENIYNVMDRMMEADLKEEISTLKNKYFIDVRQIIKNFQSLEKRFIDS